MDVDSLARELHRALADAVGIPAADVDSAAVLISAGEWQVALETLCTQIYEYDLEVSDGQRALLNRLGRLLNVPVDHLLGDPWADNSTES